MQDPDEFERQIAKLLQPSSHAAGTSRMRVSDDEDDDDNLEIIDEDSLDDEDERPPRAAIAPPAKKQKTSQDGAPPKTVIKYIPTKLYTDVLEEKLNKDFEKEQPPRMNQEGSARQMDTPEVDLDDQLLEEIRQEDDEANGFVQYESEKRRAVRRCSLTCKICRITEAIKTGRTDGTNASSAYRDALNLYSENVLEMNKYDLYRAIALKFNETCGVYDKNVTKKGISLWKPVDVIECV